MCACSKKGYLIYLDAISISSVRQAFAIGAAFGMAISILVATDVLATVRAIDTCPAATLLSGGGGGGGMSWVRVTVTVGLGALALALKHVAILFEEPGRQRSLCSVPLSTWSVLVCPVNFGGHFPKTKGSVYMELLALV